MCYLCCFPGASSCPVCESEWRPRKTQQGFSYVLSLTWHFKMNWCIVSWIYVPHFILASSECSRAFLYSKKAHKQSRMLGRLDRANTSLSLANNLCEQYFGLYSQTMVWCYANGPRTCALLSPSCSLSLCTDCVSSLLISDSRLTLDLPKGTRANNKPANRCQAWLTVEMGGEQRAWKAQGALFELSALRLVHVILFPPPLALRLINPPCSASWSSLFWNFFLSASPSFPILLLLFNIL